MHLVGLLRAFGGHAMCIGGLVTCIEGLETCLEGGDSMIVNFSQCDFTKRNKDRTEENVLSIARKLWQETGARVARVKISESSFSSILENKE